MRLASRGGSRACWVHSRAGYDSPDLFSESIGVSGAAKKYWVRFRARACRDRCGRWARLAARGGVATRVLSVTIKMSLTFLVYVIECVYIFH